MKITKLFPGLKQIANGDYVFEGNISSDETIEIDLDDRLVVKGSIVSKKNIIAGCGIEAGEGIEAGWGIEAGCGIKAGWGIEAGEGIEAGWGIEAGEGIKAGWGIEAGCGIEAGEGIEAKKHIDCKLRIFAGIAIYRSSRDCKKTIKCAELRNGEVAYGDLVIEKPVVTLTLAEVSKRLGIENLKIEG